MTGERISRRWGVPSKEVSCPDCGKEYGHNNTKVDTISELCSTCIKKRGEKTVELISAEDFVSTII